MLDMILNMSLITLLMCALSCALFLLQKKTKFFAGSKWKLRLVAGLLFGGAAIASTHTGVTYESMILNVRDVAPLAAGLFFDPLAGLMAGVIGGAERFIVGQWFGIGSYTRVACGLSTFLAGVLSALLGKLLFEGKKPSAFYAFAVGAIMEVFHMLAVLLTHVEDIATAFEVVRICAGPMVLFTAFGLALSSLALSALSGEYRGGIRVKTAAETPVTKRIQLWLLLFITVLFALTFSFTFFVQSALTVTNQQTVLRINAEDIASQIEETDKNLLAAEQLLAKQGVSIARSVAYDVDYAGGVNRIASEQLKVLAQRYDLYEINLVGKDGLIIASTNSRYVGFDMNSGGQSAAFSALLDGTETEMVQDFQPTAYDKNTSVMYIGVACKGGYAQIGYNEAAIKSFSDLADASAIATDRHIGENGNVYVINGIIIESSSDGNNGTPLFILGVSLPEPGSFFYGMVNGVKCYCYYVEAGKYGVLLTVPEREMFQNRDIFAYETAFAEILLFVVIFILIYVLIRKIIVANLERVNRSLALITGGNLDEEVQVRASSEFSSLSKDINATVHTLKKYISEAENRIKAELEFARSIQHSALPSVFPPFPERDEFELYASMNTAKEVGGDFYDFFLVDHDHLALVMADVSGKGIPASLFMMKSKTLMKSLAESGLPPEEVLTIANKKLCEGNDAEMFVTVWLGILCLSTGEMSCVNAGHEYPAVKRANGQYELLHDKHGFVLGGMDMVTYRPYTLSLHPGDRLFVYTDGVTEATDGQNQLFGNDRLVEALNQNPDAAPEATVAGVQQAIDRFVGAAPQFDDITMLALYLKGDAQ